MLFTWWLKFARRFVRPISRSQRRWQKQHARTLQVETLEGRDLPGVFTPDSVLIPTSGVTPFGSSSPSGLSPAQIRQAYGFNQISFGGTTGDGTGTTIAIVDAYNDPYIQSDLHNFDQQFGLPDPKLTVVNQNGGSSLSTVNAGGTQWGGEISLDVELAHAIAPGANILLVEANTDTYSELFTGVQYAAGQPGVVAVSMSWGGGEFSGENWYDSTFQTPSGHSGVVFVASSGDSGAPIQYPSSSPNVLAVGGTSLSVDSQGNYLSETAWSGSGGGISAYESQPSYQQGVVTQSTTMRTGPDVAYDADPGSGFAVYDTDGNSASSPWLQYGGTSVGAPQWAALVAIADQGRALSGEAAFTNSTLMPKLYDAPSADFHDITTGTSGGSPNYSAGPGYDLVTGLGSPVANVLVSNLVGQSSNSNSATHFSISAPTTATAGGSFSVTVTALNSSNQQVNNYTGTIDFTSTDTLAGLPSNYTFTSSDNGSHTFTITLKTAGSETITATDTSNSSIEASDSVSVAAGAVSSLSVSGPSTATAGTSFSETVTALDAYGNVVTSYTGTVHFTSSDGAAGLPANYTFTSSDNGSHTFTITLKTAGSQTVTATDTSNSSLQSSLSVNVAAGAATLFRVSDPSTAIAGTSFNEIVTILDAYGNVVTNYTGTIHFTSTDGAAGLPANYTFTSSDNGSHTFTITLKTEGSQTVTATDTNNSSVTGNASVSVSAGAASSLSVSGSSTATAGTSFSETVTVFDAYGNVATGYTGTIHFTSTDGAAGLPANYTFTSSNNGSHTFTITLKTEGSQTIAVADTSNSSIEANASISVAAGAVSSLSVSDPITEIAGIGFSETVTAFDAYGNVATGYTGTVHFTSTDSAAGLPANYTFVSSDNGSHTFTITLKTVGSQTITATDTSNSSLHSSLSLNVVAGAASSLSVTGSSTATAGTSFNETVTAFDAYGNVATGYTGTIQFSSSDVAAGLPANYTFTSSDNGSHTFTITLKTAGSQTVTATDTNNSSLHSSLSVNVAAGAATSFHVSGPSTATEGTSFSETVTAFDAYGNVATGYTGTVHFTSSDSAASLPSNYTFVSSDNGSHTFTITLKTAGSQTVTATDTNNSSVTGNASVSVSAGAVSSLSVSGPSTATAGTSFSETVTALDSHGNVVTGYTGTIQFNSSDVAAGLPSSYTFTSSDNGSHTFTITLKTAGSQTVTATDTNNSSLHSSLSVSVTAGAATSFRVSDPSTATAGTGFSETVTAFDAYGNVATGYTGTVHFTSTDGAASLPANYTFVASDNGSHTFTITLKTVGSQTITATDTSNSSIEANASVSVSAGAASSLSVSGPSTATAGTGFSETVTAFDAYGNVATGYTGTIHFTSTDSAAGLPANYTFTSSDNGSHTFTVTLKTAGSQTVTATDTNNSSLHSSLSVSVAAGAATSFRVSDPSTAIAGTGFNETVTAFDAYGNVATGYTGTVQFSSSDVAAGLPSNYTFTSSDNGSHTFTITLKTAGSQTVAATDTSNSSVTANASVNVSAGAASSLSISGPSITAAGTSFSETVTAFDAYGNVATGYTGTVHFTSSDSAASLPSNYTFVSSNNGSHTFTITLKTEGSQTIAVADTSNSSIEANTSVSVSSGAASSLSISGPSTATAGTSFSETVTVLDSHGNVATGYTGTIHFSSSDVAAGLPANYTFTSSDNGSHTFTITLKTAGSQTVTATDTNNSSLHSSLSVSVAAGAASSFRVTDPSTATAGTGFSETVTALDAYGNVATGYTGTVHFTSTDGAASLPANYTFVSSDNGSHTFTITLKTVGSQTITATDASNSSIEANASVSVSAGAASSLSVSGPSTATAGTGFSETVTAFDAYGNVATGYTGTIHFTSTDSAAGLPANYTFTSSDNGSHTFTVTLKTVGSQTITATDTSNSSLHSSLSLNVVAGAATSFRVSDPSTAIAGTGFNETVTAFDAYGNVATGYTGTVQFSSSDVAAGLPSNYTFTSSDNGSHTFTITLKTAGSQTVAATDTSNSSVTANASVNVSAGAASSLSISGPSITAAGTSFSETVTAFDAYGNVATGYTGTVHFTSSDSAASLPSNYTFVSSNNGSHTFTITLKTEGSQTIAVADTSNSSIEANTSVSVSSGAASSLSISGPSTATAGTSFSETVTVLDSHGNVATGYTGTIHFSSSDVAAGLPANYTFTSSDNGSHTFTITLKTAGSQTVTATDTNNSSLHSSLSVSVAAGAASSFRVSDPSTATAGTGFNETVTAFDAYGNVATGYTGTVQFTSSDGQATLPSNYTFVSSDNGSHTFTVTLKTVGNQTIAVADTSNSSIEANASVSVAAGAASSLSVSGGPSNTTAGTGFSETVTAFDAYGNVATNYTGTVHFTSTDSAAGLPANYTFTSSDNGSHTFTVTLKTAGSQTVTATDTNNSSLHSSLSVSVAAGAASSFRVTDPSTATAGTGFSETVTAFDAYGNVATGYTGTVQFTSSDGQATLPSNYTFVSSDNGSHTFTITLKTVGSQTIAVADTSNSSIEANASISVAAGAVSSLSVSDPTTETAGTGFSETVTAFDAYGNVATGYTGTVHFTSTDSAASLPSNYTFTSSDDGSHTFTVTLKTVGSQTITATDTSNSSLQSSLSLNVVAGAVSSLSVTGSSTATAGTGFSETVTAFDAYGNLATGYTGTIHFSSSDVAAGLPANYTFTSSDNGSHTFTITLKTVGNQTVTATDTNNNSLVGNAATSVSPGAVNALKLSGPMTAIIGTSFTETVTAVDAYGNVETGYTGTVQFTSTDGSANLPANYTFTAGDNGSHSFTIALDTSGNQTITATDSNSSIAGSTSVNVSEVGSDWFKVTGSTTATAGTAKTYTLTVMNANGTVATGFTGTVHFTSTDTLAGLPANYTFTAANKGVHSFTITLKTAGTETISATDTAANWIEGNTSVSVSPAAVRAFHLVGPSVATAGTSFTETVTALDAYGNVVTSYRGAIHFATNATSATLPANYAFTAADAGVHTFTITLKTAGTHVIAATSTANSAIKGTATVNVSAAPASSFRVSGPSTDVAGKSTNEIVTVLDAFGNVVTGYTGTVHFTSSDSSASLPANYTFTSADNGVHTFAVTPKTSGTQTVIATDTNISSVTGKASIVVSAGALSSFEVSGYPASVTAGTIGTFKVTALDAFGNVATGYTGTVHFTSSDSKATLPANVTLKKGVGTFGSILKTAGIQSLTIADTKTKISVSEPDITVTPAAATHLAFVQKPTAAVVGAVVNPVMTVEILDQFNNIVTSDNTDPITLTLHDGTAGATLSGGESVTVFDGIATFSDLSVSKIGKGYILVASSGHLTTATSAAFNVT